MVNILDAVQETVYTAIKHVANESGNSIEQSDLQQIVRSQPPSLEMGDLAFPMFPLAKSFRTAPAKIAQEVQIQLGKMQCPWIASSTAAGPYVNVYLARTEYGKLVAREIAASPETYGCSLQYANTKMMIEFSCPNTNKPLHLGHLRNNALGSCMARLYAAAGAEVERVNLINDRGVHICKSMLAYQKFGNGESPQSTGKKSDHFVGDYYVRFAQWAKEDESAEQQAADMLQRWEDGDPDVLELWKTMNGWAIDGINQTYEKTGIEFDRVYYESQTYLSGKKEILEGLERGIFYKSENGAIMVDLAEIGLDTKVLLRSDGTSLYLTQDIGTAIARHKDWPFDAMIYVVGSEQQYHFRVLFHVLQLLGYSWARNLEHLSYGMVNLPDGKMKSREGTVVDADDLLEQLTQMALQELKDREREEEVRGAQETAHAIALGALHYYLVNVTPTKDMVFDPSASLSFTGNTGPYLQYVGARISSMMRKAGFQPQSIERTDFEKLELDIEWNLIRDIGNFPRIVARAAESSAPSELANYLFELGKTFSRYYHDTPIFQGVDESIASARLSLCWCILVVFRQSFQLLGIPFLERM